MSDEEFVDRYTRSAVARQAYNRVKRYIEEMENSHRKDVSIAIATVTILAAAAVAAFSFYIFTR